jgi:hypothetical protein
MSYVANKIFENESVNYVLDSLMDVVGRSIGLGGRGAENLYASTNIPLQNIVLVTNEVGVMEVCRLLQDFFKAKNVFHYKDRSIYYTDVFCIEIWYDVDTTLNDNYGIIVQDRSFINPETL